MSDPQPWSWQLQHVVFPARRRQRSPARNVAPSSSGPAADRPEPDAIGLPPPGAAEPFVEWLFGHAGLSAAHYRPETLRRRLPACLRVLRAHSAEHARAILEQSPDLVPAAVSALLVGVTSFFRDHEPFEQLRALLPELVDGRRGPNVWSAGCSDGAELYSVAMLVAEAGRLGEAYLLGTDCRPDAVRTARAGRYDTASIRGVPDRLLRRYFEFRDGAWEIDPALRRAVRWRAGDVLTTPEPGGWDVISFRNTAMYMRPEAAYPLWMRFEQALRPGGLLILGKAERPVGAGRLTCVGPCLYRRTRG
jgi:chemotaxis methyl-accepting protein methylase